MGSSQADQDELFERLSAAIMQSITSSKDVKELLKKMGKEGLINESAVFNLLLSLEELDQHVNPKPVEDGIYKLEPADAPPKQPKTVLEFSYAPSDEFNQLIDGKKLSEREKLFEDYCRESFDEKTWMKRARIKI